MKLSSPAPFNATSHAARRSAAPGNQPEAPGSQAAAPSESVTLSNASQTAAADEGLSAAQAKKIGIGACVVAALSLVTVAGIAAGIDAGTLQAGGAVAKAGLGAMMTGMVSGTVGYAMLRAPQIDL